MIRCFFLLICFSVVEDYELSKSTSHILSVPLNLESETDLGLLQHPRWSTLIIVNGFQPLTIITKHSILDIAAALDPPLGIKLRLNLNMTIWNLYQPF